MTMMDEIDLDFFTPSGGEDDTLLTDEPGMAVELDALDVTEGIDFANLDPFGVFGAERAHRRVANKSKAEKLLAGTLAAAGQSDPDDEANAVAEATGGDPTAIAAVTKGVRIAHVKRHKKKGDLDVEGIVSKRAHKYAGHHKSAHAKHKHARDAAEKKLAGHFGKRGHKGGKAAKLARLARRAAGGDPTTMAALAGAVAGASSGPAFNLASTFGQVSPGLASHYQRLAAQSGESIAPPTGQTGGFLGLGGAAGGPSGDKLMPGQTLAIGQSMLSASGGTKISMNSDKTLALYDPTRGDKYMNWHITNAQSGSGSVYLLMQPDGNLVLKDSTGATFWSSGNGTPGAYFMVQNDGNLVVYDPSGNVLWSPHTLKNFGRKPQPPQGSTLAAQGQMAQAAAAPMLAPVDTLPDDSYLSGTQPAMSDADWNDTDPTDGAAAGDGGAAAAPSDGGDGGGAAPSDGGDGAPQYATPTASATSSGQAAPQYAPPTGGGDGGGGDGGDGGGDGAAPSDGSAVSGDIVGYEPLSMEYESHYGLRG